MIGLKFGRLTVLAFDSHRRSAGGFKLAYYKCRCDCGKEVVVLGRHARVGHTKSCGCLSRERATKHGGSQRGPTFPLYRVWSNMWKRCCNPNMHNYYLYGGRGITVDPRWRDFKVFVDDMMPTYQRGLSIERKDNDGPYSKENCTWADAYEQQRNKRTNVWLELNGERLIMADWARRLGVRQKVIWWRLNDGWNVEKALTTPARPRRKTI